MPIPNKRGPLPPIIVAPLYDQRPLPRARVIRDACRILRISTAADAVRWLEYALAVGVAE